MKKVLTVLLAVVMMFAFSATAFAADYTDIDNCTDAGKVAINKLSALEVLEGKGDGKFDPAGDVTRAEMAKICTILAGKLDVAEKLMDKASNYTDVKVSVWYTGYVNEADALGIVQGDPAGTFRPNDNVTMAEAIAMLLRTAGYTDNLPGPWYIDYLNQAVEEGLVDDVDFVYNKAASREEVAIMAEALLDVLTVEWDAEENDHVWAEDSYDVLDQAFGEFVHNMNVTAVSVVDEEYEEIEICGTYPEVGNDGKETGKNITYGIPVELDVTIDGTELTNIVGREVQVIVDPENEVATYIEVLDQIIEVQEAEVTGSQASPKVKLDGVLYDLAGTVHDDDAADDANETLYAVINSDDEVTCVFADDRTEEIVKHFGVYEVVTDVNTDKEDAYEVTVNDEAQPTPADADDIIALQDGERIYATDVEVGDVVYNQYNNELVEVIADPSFDGQVGKHTAKVVTVDGEEYAYAGAYYATIDDEEYKTFAPLTTNELRAKFNTLADDETEVAVYYNDITNAIQLFVEDVTEAEDVTNYAIVLDIVTDVDNTSAANGTVTTVTYVLHTEDGVKEIVKADDANFDAPALYSAVKYTVNDDAEIKNITPVDTYSATKNVIDNKYVQLGNNKLVVNSDAVIWDVQDDVVIEDLTKAEVLAKDTIIGADMDPDTDDNVVAPQNAYIAIALDEDGHIEFMAITNFGGIADVDYAIVDLAYDNAGKHYVQFVGDTEVYEANADCSALVDKLVSYDVVAGKAQNVQAVTGYAVENGVVFDYTDGLLALDGGAKYTVDDNAVLVVLEDGAYTYYTGSIENILADDNKVNLKVNDGDVDLIVLVK